MAPLRALRPMPDMPRWTAAAAKAAIWALPKSRAVGLDGWRAAELREAPDDWYGAMARLYQEVEDTGSWPPALAQPEGLLLPNPKLLYTRRDQSRR